MFMMMVMLIMMIRCLWYYGNYCVADKDSNDGC